jgi:WD domain, G-beta repeat.
VSFSPDGTRILSGSLDNTIKLWKTKTAQTLMTIYLLPGNEWLAFQAQHLFYNASHQGDEWAAIRFDNRNDNIFPYRL